MKSSSCAFVILAILACIQIQVNSLDVPEDGAPEDVLRPFLDNCMKNYDELQDHVWEYKSQCLEKFPDPPRPADLYWTESTPNPPMEECLSEKRKNDPLTELDDVCTERMKHDDVIALNY